LRVIGTVQLEPGMISPEPIKGLDPAALRFVLCNGRGL
jgi:hypothetical protein